MKSEKVLGHDETCDCRDMGLPVYTRLRRERKSADKKLFGRGKVCYTIKDNVSKTVHPVCAPGTHQPNGSITSN